MNLSDIMLRGSRKHVLDWTSRPEFCVELLQLVAPVDVRISAQTRWMPRGYTETAEARLETFGPEILPNGEVWTKLRGWWLAHERGANTPNWDLAMGCEIERRPGLILVEAKANVPELSIAGKPIDSAASAATAENHQRIGLAVNEACVHLQRISATTAISRDTHYQLSNRVAFAWKLASLGVPIVLVYLGFSGDDGIADAGTPFADSSHWKEAFAAYAHHVVPQDLFERRIDCGPAPAWFLVRSRPVIKASPSRGQRDLEATIEVSSKAPAACSEADVAAFCEFVREGGQVRNVDLEGRVKSAKTLVFLKDGPTLAGTAAIKTPTAQHKRRVFEGAHVPEIQQDFNLELGYIVVAQQYRGRKLSRLLVEKALDNVGAVPLFATSRSDRQPMHSTLVRFSFQRVGDPYPSDDGEMDVLLFVRRRPNLDAVAEARVNDGTILSTKPEATSCAYLGVDVTDRFSNQARPMDVCGLDQRRQSRRALLDVVLGGPRSGRRVGDSSRGPRGPRGND